MLCLSGQETPPRLGSVVVTARGLCLDIAQTTSRPSCCLFAVRARAGSIMWHQANLSARGAHRLTSVLGSWSSWGSGLVRAPGLGHLELTTLPGTTRRCLLSGPGFCTLYTCHAPVDQHRNPFVPWCEGFSSLATDPILQSPVNSHQV